VATGVGVGEPVGVGEAVGVGVGVPPPPPSVRRGEITQPTVSKRQNTATQMPAGEKPRFNLNIGFILCHHNPVLTIFSALFVQAGSTPK
jgi:hypothetical protein